MHAAGIAYEDRIGSYCKCIIQILVDGYLIVHLKISIGFDSQIIQ